MEESIEQKWNRVQQKVQQALLTSNPNPNRDGCPDGGGLADLAKRAAGDGSLDGDGAWEHVKRCSPCYQDFLTARDKLRRSNNGANGTGDLSHSH
jgi:hypothetical protein